MLILSMDVPYMGLQHTQLNTVCLTCISIILSFMCLLSLLLLSYTFNFYTLMYVML